jgi:hypothetical protein
MYIQPADTVVLMYDDAAGSNGNTAKTTGANGQVVVYVEPGAYRLSVNGVDSYIDIDSRSQAVSDLVNLRKADSILSSGMSIFAPDNKCMLKKLRDSLYEEFAVYTPLTPDGKNYIRWLITNRFNITNDGAPRVIGATLASLYPATDTSRIAANNVSETRVTSTTATRTSSAGTPTGTWVGPATVLTTTDVLYSSTIGDTLVYTITGVERIELRALLAGNGGIGKITIKESAVEIDESNYLIPSDHLINFISTATGNTTMHFPLAEGLDSGLTYEVTIEVDASNPVGNRVYQAGLLGFNDIAYNDVGINGIVLDSSLGGQTNSLTVASGTTAVYQLNNTTKIDWRYVENPTGSIVNFQVFDSVGGEIASYENQTVDQYATGSTSKKVTVAKGMDKGTYYLHVINGKTKNASSTDYRYYDFGVLNYDETTSGSIGVDEFDDYDMVDNDQDPNNGTEYMLIGSGNLEVAISARKTTETVGDEEFLGGIHGYETTPTPTYKANGAAIDYAGASAGDSFVSESFSVEFDTTLKFFIDSTDFCDVSYSLGFGQCGYTVNVTKTTLADSYIHDDYGIMLNVPSTDTGNQGLLVGGGFENVLAGDNYLLNSYDNSGTFIDAETTSAAFLNSKYTVLVKYTKPVTANVDLTISPYNQGDFYSLIQDRTDRTIKFYTKSFSGSTSSGILVPSGTSWTTCKHYQVAQSNLKGLAGII